VNIFSLVNRRICGRGSLGLTGSIPLPLHASSLRNLNSTPLPSLCDSARTPNLFPYLTEKGELILGGQFPFKNGLADDGNHAGIVGG